MRICLVPELSQFMIKNEFFFVKHDNKLFKISASSDLEKQLRIFTILQEPKKLSEIIDLLSNFRKKDILDFLEQLHTLEFLKLKSEFDNLSQILKEVKKKLSIKETEINKCISCKEDLILLKEKITEKKDKQERLSELLEERQTIDKNIESSKSEYIDFQKSHEFLNTSNALGKINCKKNEIVTFKKNLINMISNLSRPITKFSYTASKETQGKLATMMNEPIEIFDDNSQYVQLLNELKKRVTERSIQIKDPEKTIHQIDEITSSIPSLSSKLKNLNEELNQLESSVNSKNMVLLEDMKSKTELYEKYRLENISMTEQIRNSVDDLDSATKILKEKIEDSVSEVTETKYSILQSLS